MLFFTDIKTGIQQQLEWFLDGKNLPIEVGALIIRDLSDDKSDPEQYVDILSKVKSKLTDSDILINNNVLYVDYDSGVETSKSELATLVRMINLRYSGQFTIILNHEEVLYVPSDYKYTTSHNEMMKDLEALVKNNRNRNGYKKRLIKAGKEVQEEVDLYNIVGMGGNGGYGVSVPPYGGSGGECTSTTVCLTSPSNMRTVLTARGGGGSAGRTGKEVTQEPEVAKSVEGSVTTPLDLTTLSPFADAKVTLTTNSYFEVPGARLND